MPFYVIKYTSCKNALKVYNSVASSTFAVPYNIQFHNFFITLNGNPGPIKSRHFSFSPSPNPWLPLTQSISVNTRILHISYKQNHTVCGLLCLASFT